MMVVFLLLGVYILLLGGLPNFEEPNRTIIGWLFLLYGVYRAALSYNAYRRSKFEKDDEQ